MAVRTHVLEHFRQIIWYSLDNNLLDNAVFVAERLFALDNDDQDSRHLLGLSMFRAGRIFSSYSMTRGSTHLGCAFVFAQACKRLEKYSEGLSAIELVARQIPQKWSACNHLANNVIDLDDHADNTRNHLPDLGAMLCLAGHLHKGAGDNKRAMDSYIEALRTNPYLWEAFDGLIELGVSLRVENCFRPNSGMRALRESTQTTNINGPMNSAEFPLSQREFAELSETTSHASFQPTFNWGKPQSTFLSRFNPPTTPGTPTGHGLSTGPMGGYPSPMLSTSPESTKPTRPPSRSMVDALRGRTTGKSTKDTIQKKVTEDAGNAQNARRSTRLLSSTRNAKPSLNAHGTIKDSRRSGKGANATINNTRALPALQKETKVHSVVPSTMRHDEREEAETLLLSLCSKIGEGCYALSRYCSDEAIAAFKSLPLAQANTPYVTSRRARAFYENRDLAEACREFETLRLLDPGRLEDMEVYSTVLFHLGKEVDLAFLAHELVDLDWLAPQTWCVIGNSFASQHEHDQAISCFRRAIQLDPRFAYAYSLQGLEHTENEEFDKARQSFMNALRANKRLYHAWYGLGSVEFKAGKNQAAIKCFKAASNLNPTNSIILCCIGNCLERAGDYLGALEEYKRAVEISPLNISARYQLARMCIHLKYFDAGEAELLRLKDASPDNAKPYFMLGRVYKAKGDRTKALQYFTVALSLDPKASHIIREQIESLDETVDDNFGNEGEVYKMDEDDEA